MSLPEDLSKKRVVDEAMLRAFAKGLLDEQAEDRIIALLEERPDLQEKVAAISIDGILSKMKVHRQIIASKSLSSQIGDNSSDGQPKEQSSEGESARSQKQVVDLPTELSELTDYRIIKELGRGGMGVVYLAEHTFTGRKEVLKVLNERLMSHSEARKRFEQEVKCIATLNHEAIVRCYTVRMMPRTMVLAMEHISGSDLHKFIARNGRLPIHLACGIATEICSGLQHAMDAGLVHRDIKPSNIMVYKSDGKLRAKILDFGLARLAESKSGGGLTQDGAMLGTLEYISPEQSMDANKADIRSDIYSLGCTLYHTLVGHPPFSGSQGELILAHSQKIPPTVNLIRPSVPVELAEVIARMMAKEPSRRYSTPREVAEALKPFLSRKANDAPAPNLSLTGAPETHGPVVEASRDTSVEVGSEQKQPTATALTEEQGLSNAAGKAGPDKIDPQTPRTLVADQMVPSRSRGRKRQRRSPFLAVALGSVASLVIFAAILGIIKIRTANGTIVIENFPAEAEVLVDGEKVEIKWDGQQATVTAKPGERMVEVKQGDMTIEGERVVVRRAETLSFSISSKDIDDQGINRPDATANLARLSNDNLSQTNGSPFQPGQTWRGVIFWKQGVQRDNAPNGANYELTIREVDVVNGTFSASYRWDNAPSGHPDVGGSWEVQGSFTGNQATWKTGDIHIGKHSANLFDDRIEVTLMLPSSHGVATLRQATTSDLHASQDQQQPAPMDPPPAQVEPPTIVDPPATIDPAERSETSKGICLSDDPEMKAWTALPDKDPREFRELPRQEQQQALDQGQIKKQREWQWSNGEIRNLKPKYGTHLTTIQSFRDFELNLEFNMDAGADSGVMLKETPQVQIWDTTKAGGKWDRGAQKGSGGLWNNQADSPGRDPLVRADKPFGQWNSMRIIQVGARTSVWLNDQLVVDQAIMENDWNRSLPLIAEGRIQLQTHSGQVRWRNIYVRELPVDEANGWLAQRDATGFRFSVEGSGHSGWHGAEYVEIDDFARVYPPRWGSVFHHEFEQDCTYRAQFRLLPDGNSKISILVPMRNRPKRGFVEVEIFDTTKKNSELSGKHSRVDLALAKLAVQPGYLRPPGEWNFAEYKIVGTTLRVELNGNVVFHDDLWRNAQESSVKSLPANDKYKNRVGMAMFGSSIDTREMQFRPE